MPKTDKNNLRNNNHTFNIIQKCILAVYIYGNEKKYYLQEQTLSFYADFL